MSEPSRHKPPRPLPADPCPLTPGPLSIVAIVGRPNVGKSTLFNRIVGRRRAIVEDVPGVTRDRHYADADWAGRAFTAVDTGGFLARPDDPIVAQVRDQATLAIDEADVVVLVADGREGLTASDEELAAFLRRSGRPVLLAVNKVDSERREAEGAAADFHRLGLPGPYLVSAEHGRGVGDLLDEVVRRLPTPTEAAAAGEAACRVAVVGRPNVGKSTLVNRLLREERFVASETPGTTRDSIDARRVRGGQTFVLTDTAGIRRKRSIAHRVEAFAVVRAIRAIEGADVVVLLLDANEPAVEQDAHIAQLAVEKGRALLLAVNKWDAVARGDRDVESWRKGIRSELPFAAFAPVVFVSARTGEGVETILDVAWALDRENRSRAPTGQLNAIFQDVVEEHPAPRAPGGKPVRLTYIAQIGTRPPTFAVSCNRPERVPASYRRFVLGRIRAALRLRVPMRLVVHGKGPRRRAGPRRSR